MYYIYVITDEKALIETCLDTVESLSEVVGILTPQENVPDANLPQIWVKNRCISCPLDWQDAAPPYVLPTLDFSPEYLLALAFFKLGNQQVAFQHLSDNAPLYQHLMLIAHLQHAYGLTTLTTQIAQSAPHNWAIVHHYGNLVPQVDFNTVKKYYDQALANTHEPEIQAFTAKHYANLLLDAQMENEAAALLKRVLALSSISQTARYSLQTLLSQILLAQLSIPYDEALLNQLVAMQQECIQFFEKIGWKVNAALLLIDASEAANMQQNYPQSLKFINQAIQYFKAEEIPQFLGEAIYRKATLLYTWSKNGSPQYYKSAINAFQDALKFFKKETLPHKFAEIHHNLGVLYAEIPVADQEQAIWAAFSASSFQQALEFYNKVSYPYQYAMVCNNYAIALMNFPPAKLHDNYQKAADLFEEALQIRQANNYPFERALTLMNQLELYWLTHNENEQAAQQKYQQMIGKVQEIRQLVDDATLLEQANAHLTQLEKLKPVLNTY